MLYIEKVFEKLKFLSQYIVFQDSYQHLHKGLIIIILFIKYIIKHIIKKGDEKLQFIHIYDTIKEQERRR